MVDLAPSIIRMNIGAAELKPGTHKMNQSGMTNYAAVGSKTDNRKILKKT